MITKRQLKEGKAYWYKFPNSVAYVTSWVRVITIDGDRVNFTINDDNRFIWSSEITEFRKRIIREVHDKVDFRSKQEKEAFKTKTTKIIKDFLGENKNGYINELTGKKGLK